MGLGYSKVKEIDKRTVLQARNLRERMDYIEKNIKQNSRRADELIAATKQQLRLTKQTLLKAEKERDLALERLRKFSQALQFEPGEAGRA